MRVYFSCLFCSSEGNPRVGISIHDEGGSGLKKCFHLGTKQKQCTMMWVKYLKMTWNYLILRPILSMVNVGGSGILLYLSSASETLPWVSHMLTENICETGCGILTSQCFILQSQIFKSFRAHKDISNHLIYETTIFILYQNHTTLSIQWHNTRKMLCHVLVTLDMPFLSNYMVCVCVCGCVGVCRYIYQ